MSIGQLSPHVNGDVDGDLLSEYWLNDAHDSEALCATAENLSHGIVYDPITV